MDGALVDPFDIGGAFPRSFPLRGDVQARLRDFITRKALAVPARLEALLATLSAERVAVSFRGLLGRMSRTRRAGKEDAAWERLAERIHRSGREGTIEAYPAFLFSVQLEI